MTHSRGLFLLLPLLAGLASCVSVGDANKPISTILVPATAGAKQHPLIVVLPGFGSDAQALKDHQVDEAVHRSWPQADVLLTSATFAYYAHKILVQHLEDDVLAPARKQGYRHIWLAGASVGGMGALLYEREHPHQVAGLVLFAPWLGSKDMVEEIRNAGGVRNWNPGPPPEVVNGDNFEHEMWRVVKQWSDKPREGKRIWLVCGADDKLLEANRMAAAALAPSHYLEVGGGHTWETWLTSAEKVIAEIRAHSS